MEISISGSKAFNMNNINNVIIGADSDFNCEKIVKDCTIIGSNSFMETGENCCVIGNNVKLTEDNDTKNAIYLGNTKQKMYLSLNNGSLLCERFAQIVERINNIYTSLNQANSHIYVPVNNEYIDINALLNSFENRLNHLESRRS